MNISIYTCWSDIRVVCSLAGCKFFTEDLLFVPYFQMFPFFSLNMAKVMRSLSVYKTHTQKSCNMCSTFFLLLAMYDVSQKRYPSFQSQFQIQLHLPAVQTFVRQSEESWQKGRMGSKRQKLKLLFLDRTKISTKAQKRINDDYFEL